MSERLRPTRRTCSCSDTSLTEVALSQFAGDSNGDGDVDLADYAGLSQIAWKVLETTPAGAGCLEEVFDFDDDG